MFRCKVPQGGSIHKDQTKRKIKEQRKERKNIDEL